MKTSELQDPKKGLLTESMDIGTEEFQDFQQFILSKANSRTQAQRIFTEQMALRYRMEDYLNTEPEQQVSIGSFLRSFLTATGIKQSKFAQYIGLRPSNFSKLLTGERKLNLELALTLESIFTIDAMVWLGIQTQNELRNIPTSTMEKLTKFSLAELMEN